jgi:hypothetical protein
LQDQRRSHRFFLLLSQLWCPFHSLRYCLVAYQRRNHR